MKTWTITSLDANNQPLASITVHAPLNWADNRDDVIGFDLAERTIINEQGYPIGLLRLVD